MGPRKGGKDKPTPGKDEQHTDNDSPNRDMHSPVAEDNTQKPNIPETNIDSDVDLIDNISPTKELNAALKEQKESEKDAFDILIKGNVKLKRELKKSDEKCKELLARYEVKSIELDAERGKAGELERQVREMQTEMTVLIRSAKKAGVVGKGPNKGSRKGKTKADGPSPEDSDNDESNKRRESHSDADDEDKDAGGQNIRDLQLRLLRLTEEDERKSRLLISLQRELESSTRYIEELESHVDSDVKDDLANTKDSEQEGMTFITASKANNIVYAGKPQAYSYRQNIAKESVVCAIS
jgi:hypothetical protein